VTGHLGDRLQQINDQILSRTRLERIIKDFNLYELERKTGVIDDVIEQMRRDIRINILTSHDPQQNDGRVFRVSFVSSTPQTALQVTKRLTNLFIEENLRDRQVQAQGTIQFIDAQIKDVRRQIIDNETTLDSLRAQSRGRRLSQADLLPYEVLQETYKALLTKSQESMAANLERRQIRE
jgi:succinoglycan biosynthesis transport protein ExoP